MTHQRTYTFKSLFRTASWLFSGIMLFVLLASAMYRNDHLRCASINILIEGYNHEMFINDKDIENMLAKELSHPVQGSMLGSLDLRRLESSLQRDPWISKAQLFIDNRQVLHIYLTERIPVARIFTKAGRSFYIDSLTAILPLSEYARADVPVFTNMTDDIVHSMQVDTALWRGISHMGNYIKKDSFLLMQIGQIDIQPEGTYKMYPTIGMHRIEFGTAADYENKLMELSLFYKKIFGKTGLNKYSVLDLRYDKQIVATLQGTAENKTDSTSAIKMYRDTVIKKQIRKEAIVGQQLKSSRHASQDVKITVVTHQSKPKISQGAILQQKKKNEMKTVQIKNKKASKLQITSGKKQKIIVPKHK